MSDQRSTEKAQSVIEGLDQSAEPCWSPTTPDGLAFEWGEGTPHWQSEEVGREHIAAILAEHTHDAPTLALTREDAPCWHLSCAECGYRYDEDEWVSHFASRDEALSIGEDCDWHVVDDRLLCAECYLSELRSSPASEGGQR